MKMKRCIPLVLQLVVLLSCVPMKAQAAVEMKYFYGGVELPYISSVSDFPYITVYCNSSGDYRVAYSSTKMVYGYLDSYGGYCFYMCFYAAVKGDIYLYYKFLSDSGDCWGDLKTSSFNDSSSVILRWAPDQPLVYTNYDVLNTEGEVVFAGSDPVVLSNGVASVQVRAASNGIYRGESLQLSAVVTGLGDYSSDVTWSITSDIYSDFTNISDTGLLTVGALEVASYITVRATSVEDSSLYGSLTLSIASAPDDDTGGGNTDDGNTGGGSTDGNYSGQLNDIQNSIGSLSDQIANTDSKLEDVSTQVEALPDQITDNMIDVMEQQQQDAQVQGDSSAQEVIDMIPDQSGEMLDALKTLVSVLNYEGTEAVLTMPAIKLPALNGLFPGATLLEPQEINFEYYFTLIPETLMFLVRALFDAAIVVYCVKEMMGLVGDAVNGFANVGKEMED